MEAYYLARERIGLFLDRNDAILGKTSVSSPCEVTSLVLRPIPFTIFVSRKIKTLVTKLASTKLVRAFAQQAYWNSRLL